MEIWKDIKGYEGLYQISNLGRVKSTNNYHRHGLVKKPRVRYLSPNVNNKNEYIYVTFHNFGNPKSYKVHRLIAEAFIPNPLDKPQINHINSNKKDNRIENLEWCDAKENKLHSLQSGTSKTGENHQDSKLSNDDVKDIRNLIGKFRCTELARKYKVSSTTIYYIRDNKTRIYG